MRTIRLDAHCLYSKTTEKKNNGGVHKLQISIFCGFRIAIKSTSLGFFSLSFLAAMVIFSTSGLIMVVVSFFTKKVPRDELGGLTWPTINDPPISHGAIGEEAECERIENGNARVAGNSDGIELLKKGETTRCFLTESMRRGQS